MLGFRAQETTAQGLQPKDRLAVRLTGAEARELARRLLALAAGDAPESAPPPSTGPAPKSAREASLPFTATQGRYLGFIHRYQTKYGCAPAESNIQRHMLVSAPTVNQMLQRRERAGLIARTPRQARSIRLLVPPGLIPPP